MYFFCYVYYIKFINRYIFKSCVSVSKNTHGMTSKFVIPSCSTVSLPAIKVNLNV